MEGLIRDIIELDKKKRLELEELKKQKNKISSFIREKRQEIEKKYKKEAEAVYAIRKAETDEAIVDAEKLTNANYKNSLKEMEIVFEEHRQEWIKSLYEFCTNFETKEE